MLLALALTLVSADAAAPTAETMRIAVHLDALRDTNRADVEASMKVWAEEIMKVLEVPAEIRFYENLADIRRDLNSGRVNFVIADGINLLRHFDVNDFSDGFGGGGANESILLLVARRGAGIESPRDLSGKRVVLLSQNEISDLVLETLCLRHLKRDCGRAGLVVDKESRSQRQVFNLFFGKADAAVVRGYAFELAVELNPQIREQVRVLERIPIYPGALGLFGRQTDPAFREYVIGKVPSIQKHPRGQQILQVMQTERVIRFPRSILDPIQALLREHESLRRRVAQAGARP
jgi:ABC-type phosphate/phosphonate transport system substrate-binding protein